MLDLPAVPHRRAEHVVRRQQIGDEKAARPSQGERRPLAAALPRHVVVQFSALDHSSSASRLRACRSNHAASRACARRPSAAPTRRRRIAPRRPPRLRARRADRCRSTRSPARRRTVPSSSRANGAMRHRDQRRHAQVNLVRAEGDAPPASSRRQRASSSRAPASSRRAGVRAPARCPHRRLQAVRIANRLAEHLEAAADADDRRAPLVLFDHPAGPARVRASTRRSAIVFLRARQDDEVVVARPGGAVNPVRPRQQPEVGDVRQARKPDDGDARAGGRGGYAERESSARLSSASSRKSSRIGKHAEARRRRSLLEDADAFVEQRRGRRGTC